uniref:His-Cys box homing endonuclease n=1 Tax=Heterolobosea sp. BA TaxID=373143 RepID=A7ISR6_9EUKA|nr:His-Cys box homing endonuclease [Heterolobosea sp. BA]
MVKYFPYGHIIHRLGRRNILLGRASTKRKTKKVIIDASQFRDGFDSLIETNYHKKGYEKLANAPNVKEPLGKGNALSAGKSKSYFHRWANNRSRGTGRMGRQSRTYIPTLTKVLCCEHGFGECLLGASNKSKSGFKCSFLSDKGSDGYVHHVSILANSRSSDPIHKLALIKKVSQRKKEKNAYSVSHLCGNGGCARPGHIIIEPKTVNDERVACHRFLRSCKCKWDARVIRRLCPHKPKCFVNTYVGIKAYY